MCKTIITLLIYVAITIFITNGCVDKSKAEAKVTTLDERVTMTTTEIESQTIDKDTTPAYINVKDTRLKCKKNAEGRLECVDADIFRLRTKSVLEKNRDTWYRFFIGNNDSCLEIAGFKDKNGVTRLDVNDWYKNGTTRIGVYNLLWRTRKFDDIIIADGYYHTKIGKKVGRDSVIYSLSPECCYDLNCESEGFIVFNDQKHDKKGMFNHNGDIAIPAEYNVLKRVQNGMIIARKGAARKRERMVEIIKGPDGYKRIPTLEDCGGDGDYEMCYWVGGTWLLIDTLNNVLIEDLDSNINLNLFSVKKTEESLPDTTIRKSFLAKNGGYYSIILYEKELMYWLTHNLLKNLTIEKLVTATYDSLQWESAFGQRSRINRNKRSFVTDNFKSLKKILMDILNPEFKIDISIVPFDVRYDGFHLDAEKYQDNCGNHKYWIYPAMEVNIRYKDYKRNKITFLRTDNGYKLIGVEIKNDDNFRPTD